MSLNYWALSEDYRPTVIETLLVAEAPPPGGQAYFYLPATVPRAATIRETVSLPATIFFHYFKALPANKAEYLDFLEKLKSMGVFLVDIYDDPIKVNHRHWTPKEEAAKKKKEAIETIKSAIPLLRRKLKERKIAIADERITFVMPRTDYNKHIRQEFPRSQVFQWVDFRMHGVEE